jgi:peptidoglycan/xylan/chitin deacetylase (PgdA/CDA1 family)
VGYDREQTDVARAYRSGKSPVNSLWGAAERYYKRNSGRVLFRKPVVIRTERPLISFTFDDFPRTALETGGAILKDNGLHGTYYVALGLLGTESPSGRIVDSEDLVAAMEQGHELGCHTFSHDDSWETSPPEFERSIVQNQRALEQLTPGVPFRSFSYPRSSPKPSIKRIAARHFLSCRGGGQAANYRSADLNQLSAFFLEKTCGDLKPVERIIDFNRDNRGWLIFATHDVGEQHGRYGCTPEFFEAVVERAVASGARILTVGQAVDAITANAR